MLVNGLFLVDYAECLYICCICGFMSFYVLTMCLYVPIVTPHSLVKAIQHEDD